MLGLEGDVVEQNILKTIFRVTSIRPISCRSAAEETIETAWTPLSFQKADNNNNITIHAVNISFKFLPWSCYLKQFIIEKRLVIFNLL